MARGKAHKDQTPTPAHLADGAVTSTEPDGPSHMAQSPRRRLLEGSPRRLKLALTTVAILLVITGALSFFAMHARVKLGALTAPNFEQRVAESSDITRQLSLEAMANEQLKEAVAEMEDKGYTLGFVLIDLQDGSTLASYNADERFYSASSVKAPFATWLAQDYDTRKEALPSWIESSLTPLLVWSDNETYSRLRNSFSREGFRAWLDEAGCSEETVTQLSTFWYAQITPQDLALMWQHAYPTLTGKGNAAQSVAELLQKPEVSSIRAVMGQEYKTMSKAGWYPGYGDWGSTSATCDAGIVFTERGDYVLAIMTDAPANFDPVSELADYLNQVHAAHTGGELGSLINATTVLPGEGV